MIGKNCYLNMSKNNSGKDEDKVLDNLDFVPVEHRSKVRDIAKERNDAAQNLSISFLTISLIFYSILFYISAGNVFILIILVILSFIINSGILQYLSIIDCSIIISLQRVNDFNKNYLNKDENKSNNQISLKKTLPKICWKVREFSNKLGMIVILSISPIIISLLIVLNFWAFLVSFILNGVINYKFISKSEELEEILSNYLFEGKSVRKKGIKIATFSPLISLIYPVSLFLIYGKIPF